MAKLLFISTLVAATAAFAVGASAEKAAPSASKTKRSGLKADGTPKINHIVVAMLENRAFDHMFGWLPSQWNIPVDGLSGNETNTIVAHDGTTTVITVNDQCPYVNVFDPLHGVFNTTNEIMNGNQWINPAPMSGFAQTHYYQGFPTPGAVLEGFGPDRVPAISTLAKEFSVFDKYFASLPGPTFPNRLYFQSGTSHGMVYNTNLTALIEGSPQQSIYDVLEAHNMTWTNYFEDLPDSLLFSKQRYFGNKHLKPLSDFTTDAAAGNLPYFSWINPRFFSFFGAKARDQHPDHDVVLGEEFIKEVYEGLRNSPNWENTLLIVTYDEHGGFYDHVPPPADGIPNPDGIVGGQGTINEFNFTRMGVRVPFVAISPYIKKGQIVSYPKGAPATQFEHSSMYATLKKLNGFPEELTARTAFAAPFDFLFDELDTPRTDCPTTLPLPSASAKLRSSPINKQKTTVAEALQNPNDLQLELWQMLMSTVADLEKGAHPSTTPTLLAEARARLSTVFTAESSARHAQKSGHSSAVAGGIKSVSRRRSEAKFLHERMQGAVFATQHDMALAVHEIVEAITGHKQQY